MSAPRLFIVKAEGLWMRTVAVTASGCEGGGTRCAGAEAMLGSCECGVSLYMILP